MKAGAETPATVALDDQDLVSDVRSMKAGAETPATVEDLRC